MKQKNKKPDTETLRQKAEDSLKAKNQNTNALYPEADKQKLIHELQVHQIELELQNEELLKANELAEIASVKYTEIYDFAPSGYFTLSNQRKIIGLNIKGANILGKERSKLINNQFGFFISQESKPSFNLFFEKLFLDNGIETCEISMETNDNSPLYILLSGVVSNDREQCFLTAVDITQRKKAEDDLRKNETKFRIVADYAYDWEYWEGRDNLIIYTSPSCERISGYTPEEFLNNHHLLTDIMNSNDFELFKKHAQLAHSPKPHPEILDINFRIIKKDGSIAFINHLCRAVFDENGSYLGRRITNRDITKHKHAEYELLNKDALMNITGETAKVGGWEIDIGTMKITWTNEVYRIYEVDSQFEPDVNSVSSFYTPQSRLVLENAIQRATDFGEPYDLELEFITQKGKHLWVHSIGKAYQQNGKTEKIYGSFQDITERKQAQTEINQINEELKELNAEKDRLFSILAHDLRGPFNGFLGLTELMEESLPSLSTEEIQEIATTLRKSAKTLFSLLENLLEWSRVQLELVGFTPVSFSLSTKIEELMKVFGDTAKQKMIDIKIEIPKDIVILADEQMFESMMRNLVFNAIKFTHKNGNVSITAREIPDNQAEISIKDTGIGMDKDIIDHLFKLGAHTFRKGTEGEPSSGLGLQICNDLIKKHGGKLWVESEPETGSTFRLEIPCPAQSLLKNPKRKNCDTTIESLPALPATTN